MKLAPSISKLASDRWRWWFKFDVTFQLCAVVSGSILLSNGGDFRGGSAKYRIENTRPTQYGCESSAVLFKGSAV